MAKARKTVVCFHGNEPGMGRDPSFLRSFAKFGLKKPNAVVLTEAKSVPEGIFRSADNKTIYVGRKAYKKDCSEASCDVFVPFEGKLYCMQTSWIPLKALVTSD